MSPAPRLPHGVAAVVLAAGESRRFGSPKQLAVLGERTILEHVLTLAVEAVLDPIVAVVPGWLVRTPAIAQVLWVANPHPELGLSRSLQLGFAALPAAVEAAVILLGDQPTLPLGSIEAILARRGERPIIAALGGGHSTPPVLLERSHFHLVNEVTGDKGLRDLLRTHPDGVASVELPVVADIDTPADLRGILAERVTSDRCPGCGAHLPDDLSGPHHRYMTGSSGCWEAFGELSAKEFGEPGWGAEHRLTVDTYAAQHPGEGDRRQRQSVAIHLVALCHRLERGMDQRSLLAATRSLTADKREWPRLTPPSTYPMTVVDVLTARSVERHLVLIRRWAEGTWQAWSDHHATVRAWADEALRGVGRA